MTLWQRMLQGLTALLTSTGISMITGVVSASLTFRYLTPDEYGRLALFLTYFNTGTIFLTLGIEGIITSEVARARGEQKWGWIRKMVQLYAVLVLSMGLGLLLLFGIIGQFSDNRALWVVMGLYLLLTAPNRLLSILFHGTTRYRRMASLTVVRSVSRAGLLLLLPLWWTGDLLIGIALLYPILELLVLGTAVYLLRHAWQELAQEEAGAPSYTTQQVWDLLKDQGAYVVLSMPIKTLSEQLPVWFLRVLLGETAVGLFAAAFKTYNFIFTLFRSVETILFPLAAEQRTVAKEQLQVALRQAQKYTFWGSLLVIVGASLLAEFFLWAIAGEAYETAVPIFRILVWHLILFTFAQAQRPVLFANRELKWLFWTYVLGLLVGAVAYPVAITTVGILGAPIAYLLYIGSMVLARMIIIQRQLPDYFVHPATTFRIDPFDRLLVANIKQRLVGRNK